MTGEHPADGKSGGLLEHVRELCAAGLEYIQARLALAGIEAKEAAIHFGIILGLCIGALAVIVFGYLFLCIAITVLLAQALHISPGWVILALAVFHFLMAATALFTAYTRIKLSVFSATLAELKKDQQWLSHTTKLS
jgi:uncharacterized membrane protein YqjE